MKAIVFGGTGWVGHKIAVKLAKAGHSVTICSRGKKSDFLEHIVGIEIINADKKNELEVKDLLSKRYDIIIDSVPDEATIENIFKHAVGLKHYIHCSSTGGYTPLPFIPCNETAPYKGFPYGGGWNQKAIVDAKVMDLFNRHGFPATVIRPCYITGPGMLPLDNLGGRRSDFIPDIINGKELDLPDNGLSLLQPVHVDDLANSFRLAVENNASIGQIYNICLKKAVTLNKYLEINASVFKTSPPVNYIPLEDMIKKYGTSINEIGLRFMATHMCFDISKAEKDLAYKPAHTSEEAIEETALWAAKKLEIKGY